MKIFFFGFIIHSSFKSIEGEGWANVLDEAHDEEIPPTTLVVLFLEAFRLLQITKKGFEWSMKVPNGLAKLVNVMKLMLQTDY